jgi:glycosyltransferase involved in cell wall biosynthesis
MGGAEDVLEALVGMFPDAPVYTSMYWRKGMPKPYRSWDIRTTWLDHIPGIHQHHQLFLALYPVAFGQVDLSDYDLVLSNKSGFCHGVTARAGRHVCYCLTPTRYVWGFDEYAAQEALSPALKTGLRPLIRRLKRWDYNAAQRVDHFIAISSAIQARIRRHYGRDATIIYPPVDTDRFAPASSHDDYYLIVSRLVPYRRIDLAITAFNALGLPLAIAGDGRDRERLESMAGPTITFLGRVADADLPDLLARCRAYVLPGNEDFGIAPVQAQAAGRPVIAYGKGGALDTVVEGTTGILFQAPTPEALADAVTRFEADRVDPQACRTNAERFAASVFRSKIAAFIEQVDRRDRQGV